MNMYVEQAFGNNRPIGGDPKVPISVVLVYRTDDDV